MYRFRTPRHFVWAAVDAGEAAAAVKGELLVDAVLANQLRSQARRGRAPRNWKRRVRDGQGDPWAGGCDAPGYPTPYVDVTDQRKADGIAALAHIRHLFAA